MKTKMVAFKEVCSVVGFFYKSERRKKKNLGSLRDMPYLHFFTDNFSIVKFFEAIPKMK